MKSLDEIDLDSIVYGADYFADKSEARLYLIDRIEHLAKLPSKVELYRVVIMEDLLDLDTSFLGHHWTQELSTVNNEELLDYLKNECMGEEIPGKAYFICTNYRKSDIDMEMTLRQNVLNPHERELFVTKCGKPVGPVTVLRPGSVRFEPLALRRISPQNVNTGPGPG
jgi:hypothetical protein